jgi:hypothetical protein
LPLSLEERSRQALNDPYLEGDFSALLALWKPVAYMMNELDRSMSLGDAYLFDLTPAVRAKLHFVHMAIYNYRNRIPKVRSRQTVGAIESEQRI